MPQDKFCEWSADSRDECGYDGRPMGGSLSHNLASAGPFGSCSL